MSDLHSPEEVVTQALRVVVGALASNLELLNSHSVHFLPSNTWETCYGPVLRRELEKFRVPGPNDRLARLADHPITIASLYLEVRQTLLTVDYSAKLANLHQALTRRGKDASTCPPDANKSLRDLLLEAVAASLPVLCALRSPCSFFPCAETPACCVFCEAEVGCARPAPAVAAPKSNILPVASTLHSASFINHGMNAKKAHEVEAFGRLCAQIYREQTLDQVADIGSGKGYLGTYLSLAHGIPVLEIDSREVNIRSSKRRRANVQKFWNLLNQKQALGKEAEVVFQSDCSSLTCAVTSALQLDSLLAQAASKPNPRCLLTGLHSCGGLSVTLLRTFVQSARAAALVNAPCCYHLLQEAGGEDFVERRVAPTAEASQNGALDFPMSQWLRSEYPWLRLGRNARTVASQPLERLASLGNLLRAGQDPASISDLQAALNECFPRTTYYRVMLQQLLLDHLPPEQHRPTEWIVGRRNHQRRKLVQVTPGGGGDSGDSPPSSTLLVNVGRGQQNKGPVDELGDNGESFVSYTRWCLQRLGLEELSESLTDELIAAYPSRFPGLESRIHCHYMMRCCFGPVVEACILLDRVLFLFEAGREHSFPVNPRLVRVFDPLISPRCHAIVATK